MTTPPDIAIAHSASWAQASAADALDRWAPAAAAQLWSGSGERHTPADVSRLASTLVAVGEACFVTGCLGALFLCPEPARGVLGVARLNAMSYRLGTPGDEVLADLRLPDELQLLPPEVSEFRAPVGPALRLRQRAYSEQTRAVSDYLTYAYLFPESAWLLSMSFPLPAEAERWVPELDRMAGAVELAAAGPP